MHVTVLNSQVILYIYIEMNYTHSYIYSINVDIKAIYVLLLLYKLTSKYLLFITVMAQI